MSFPDPVCEALSLRIQYLLSNPEWQFSDLWLQINDIYYDDLHELSTALGIEHSNLKEALSFSILARSDGKMKLELRGKYLNLEVKVETFRPRDESSIQRKGERWIRFIGKRDAGVGRTLRGSNNVSAVDNKRLDAISTPYSQGDENIFASFCESRSVLSSYLTFL